MPRSPSRTPNIPLAAPPTVPAGPDEPEGGRLNRAITPALLDEALGRAVRGSHPKVRRSRHGRVRGMVVNRHATDDTCFPSLDAARSLYRERLAEVYRVHFRH